MRPGRVIGKVTMSEAAPQFRGARWLMVSPMGPDQLSGKDADGYGNASTPVVYDKLGAGIGDVILYVEGAEAMQPFDFPIPLDAISVALLDHYQFTPPNP
ncbi:MAG: EutN/CcmL family microcompartment protein [Verrucomicrobiales bacterium]|nr:EutN/CcmL family microcompartment protein [Verrucomicrobiota bacterium JB025]